MFELAIELDGDVLVLELGSFEDMWELKEWFEGEGYDVDWDYEPA